MSKLRTYVTTAGLSVVLAATASSGAAAAITGVTITGDDASPVLVAPGTTVRQMNVELGVERAAGDGGYVTVVVTGPDGVVAGTRSCATSVSDMLVDYRGNGVYTVVASEYGAEDYGCSEAQTGPAQTFSYTVAAAVGLTGPGQRVLTRSAGSDVIRRIELKLDLSPGALGTEIQYAKGGRLGADGAIVGTSRAGYIDPLTGLVPLLLNEPGRYVVVARQKGFATEAGNFFTPWSPAVIVNAVAPFDLSTIYFTDSRGPRFAIRGYVRERSTARSRVTVAMARGRTGGRFSTIARPKVAANGSFNFKFTQRRSGIYRLRVSFKGKSTVAPGSVTRLLQVRRSVR